MGPYGGYCHGGENRYGRGGPNSQWDLMEVTVMEERTGMGEVVLTIGVGRGLEVGGARITHAIIEPLLCHC